VIIRDSEIDGSLIKSDRSDFSDQRFQASVLGFNGVADLQRNYIHNVGAGIVLRDTGSQLDALIEGNYVDDLVAWGDPATTGSHNNALSIRDFTDTQRADRKAIIRNNRLELDTPYNASSALQIMPMSGPINNIIIEGNLLEGYGYLLWLFQSNNNYGNNMFSINNRFTPMSGPGWKSATDGNPGWATWEDNYIYNPSMPDGMGASASPW
jgi:hypothetical protein